MKATTYKVGKLSKSKSRHHTRRPMVSCDAFRIIPLQRLGCLCSIYNQRSMQPCHIDLNSERESCLLSEIVVSPLPFPVKLHLGDGGTLI